MQTSHTTNISAIRESRKIDGRRKDVAQSLAVADETAGPTQERKFMLTRKVVNREYLVARDAFVKLLSKDIGKAVAASNDKSIISITAAVESGRKYDKIVIATLRPHPTKQGEHKATTEVRYFVERASGSIFGAKSPLAPNETRYFGRVENAKKWDWSGPGGINESDNSVTEVGGYGDFVHYADVTETVTA